MTPDPTPKETLSAVDEATEAAFKYVLDPNDSWVQTLTIAHLRVPRFEFMEWSDNNEDALHVVAALIVDKALTALVVTTWPVHDEALHGGPHD